MMKRYHVMVDGRVQGVGFRGFCMRHAQMLGLTGSAANLDNGAVEIFVQGEEDKINTFLAKVQEGDRFIRVDHMAVKETAVVAGEKRFGYGGSHIW